MCGLWLTDAYLTCPAPLAEQELHVQADPHRCPDSSTLYLSAS